MKDLNRSPGKKSASLTMQSGKRLMFEEERCCARTIARCYCAQAVKPPGTAGSPRSRAAAHDHTAAIRAGQQGACPPTAPLHGQKLHCDTGQPLHTDRRHKDAVFLFPLLAFSSTLNYGNACLHGTNPADFRTLLPSVSGS